MLYYNRREATTQKVPKVIPIENSPNIYIKLVAIPQTKMYNFRSTHLKRNILYRT